MPSNPERYEMERTLYLRIQAECSRKGFDFKKILIESGCGSVLRGRLSKTQSLRVLKRLEMSVDPALKMADRVSRGEDCRYPTLYKTFQQIADEVLVLWRSKSYRNKPLSIAVRVGCDASLVRKIIGLPTYEGIADD